MARAQVVDHGVPGVGHIAHEGRAQRHQLLAVRRAQRVLRRARGWRVSPGGQQRRALAVTHHCSGMTSAPGNGRAGPRSDAETVRRNTRRVLCARRVLCHALDYVHAQLHHAGKPRPTTLLKAIRALPAARQACAAACNDICHDLHQTCASCGA